MQSKGKPAAIVVMAQVNIPTTIDRGRGRLPSSFGGFVRLSDMDPMVSKTGVSAGNFIFGHVTRDAVLCASRACGAGMVGGGL